MKKRRFTEAQIMGELAVSELCREHEISSATFYIYGRLSSCKCFEVVSDR